MTNDESLGPLLRAVARAPSLQPFVLAGHARYEVGTLLGEGSFGTVYEAFDRERGATVAIKLLHRSNPQSLRKFKDEFRTLAALRHPASCGFSISTAIEATGTSRCSGRLFVSRMHAVFSATLVGRAGIALATATRVPPARVIARVRAALSEIEDLPSAWVVAHAAGLRAGLASVRGDLEGTARALRTAVRAAEDAAAPLLHVLAQYALGATVGGDEGATLRGDAEALLEAWRVDRATALACVLPGAWCR